MQYDLVIFDMDGTLVDSESVSERVLTEATAMLDEPMTAEEVTAAFRGHTVEYTVAYLTKRNGGSLPDAFLPELKSKYVQAIGQELRPSTGAAAAIESLGKEAHVCVASNSDARSIAYCLEAAGLADFFIDRMFSAELVANAKPSPDLFLYAASELSVDPSRCLVIEDSILGLTAARAAGMDAVGYCGNDVRHRADIEVLGFPVFDRFDDIVAHLQAQ